ncbi:dihydrolipoyllysine-residue succinyltransferase component of 2-oxoglutarate dehydrogenase complex, mitochondrial-like [Hydractinia symbiolongicarpus]|uniref:dihydrolipoyllysine-residue succinyltransferase component of 2-oxoglutarate dehydrogenase complex, mitochondrial-like n=1 Tax=Hydractinia symbiolongicarpus TaxID=13093 RepID=UPI00254E1AC2|nr:dihydrolipoyllysine-residue succinyltransferase component of 2-oxoglutarate dehydrogenase complex, mitochondrial-like [Hydractinia symbiolongicarpus]
MFSCRCIQRQSPLRLLPSRITVSRGKEFTPPVSAIPNTKTYSFTRNFYYQPKIEIFRSTKWTCVYKNNRKNFFQTSSFNFNEFQIVHTPPFAESVTEGDVRWEKEVGDTVAEDEVVGEIETDKTALPIVSPASGVIEELFVEDGGRVEKGDQLFKIRLGDADSTAAPKEEPASPKEGPTPTPEPEPAPVQESPGESSVSGPAPTEPPPTRPRPQQPLAVRMPTPAPPPPKSQAVTSSEIKEVKQAPDRVFGTRSETKVKMNRMRQRIAQRLKDAQNINAMLTTFNEIDMSNVMDMRKQYKDIFLKKHNLKLGFMSAFIKASCTSLQQMPTVNAVIEDNYVIYRDFVDISVAVATPKGLVVPVLRDVDRMNFADIELGMSELGEKARTGSLAVEDMDGGTFTISNGGVFGSLMGTPIINPPQSAILGMHGIFDRPIAVNGKVEIRPMMYVALTYDHRLIDGREAVTFLRKIKQSIEDPVTMLLDI